MTSISGVKRKYGSSKFKGTATKQTRNKGQLAVLLRQALMASKRANVGEMKFLDTVLSFNIDTTGEVPATGQLLTIPQDATQSGRIGRKVNLKSLRLKFNVQYVPGVGGNTGTTCYIYLVRDKQTNKAAAAITDVLTSTSLQVALPNIDNAERFKIVKCWTLEFNTNMTATALTTYEQNIDQYFKLNDDIVYDASAATGAVTTMTEVNYFLIAGAFASDDQLQVSGICRARYTDK